MSNAEKHFKTITDQLAQWAKKAKQDYPQDLEDSLRSAITQVDAQGFSVAAENILALVTGKSKGAKQVRTSIGKSVTTLQRTVVTAPVVKSSSKGLDALYVLGATAVIIAACVAAMWRATHAKDS